jgi:hypothetical protein
MSDDDANNAAGSAKPRTANAMQADLVAMVMALERRIDSAGTPAEVAELAGQIRNVNRRVTALGRAALDDATVEMEPAASSLRDAIPAIVDAIQDAESAASAAQQVAGALALVDAALNTVKQVG